eukprot:m.50413 g.50413  ORF g.50413 m.50413 type:complete len:80 (+) comp11582_c0_seq1:3-242(+)
MGKLDVSLLRYLDRDAMRILQAVEVGMKNHEYVPLEIVASVAGIKAAGCRKVRCVCSGGESNIDRFYWSWCATSSLATT